MTLPARGDVTGRARPPRGGLPGLVGGPVDLCQRDPAPTSSGGARADDGCGIVPAADGGRPAPPPPRGDVLATRRRSQGRSLSSTSWRARAGGSRGGRHRWRAARSPRAVEPPRRAVRALVAPGRGARSAAGGAGLDVEPQCASAVPEVRGRGRRSRSPLAHAGGRRRTARGVDSRARPCASRRAPRGDPPAVTGCWGPGHMVGATCETAAQVARARLSPAAGPDGRGVRADLPRRARRWRIAGHARARKRRSAATSGGVAGRPRRSSRTATGRR